VGKFHFDKRGKFSKVFPEKFGVFKILTSHQSIDNRGKIPLWATKVLLEIFGAFKNFDKRGKFLS